MIPPKVFTQQNTEKQPIQRCLTSCECPRIKRKKTTGESGQHPQFRCWESPRGKTHRGEEQTRGLWAQDPDPCGWGETHMVPKPCLGPHESRLGHRVPDGWSPNAKSSEFLDPPGFLEASLVPDKSSSPALWFSLILTVSTALTIMLNTLPWFQQGPFFVFPPRC